MMRRGMLSCCLLGAALLGGCSQGKATVHGYGGGGVFGGGGGSFDGGPFGGGGDIGEPFVGPQPQFDEPAVSSSHKAPPLSGGTLLVLKDGHTAVAADPDRDQVYVVDLSAGTLTATIALQAGDEPGRVVQDAAGLVHVATRRGGALVDLDPVAGTIVGRRAVCAAPRGLAYDATADAIQVACFDGRLVTMPAAGGSATRTLTIDQDLRDVLVMPEGLLVTTFRTGQLLQLDGSGTIVNRFSLPSQQDFEGLFTPQVAWRMRQLSDGRVLIAHQLGTTNVVEVGIGGYGGSGGGCGAISRSAVTFFDPTTGTMAAQPSVIAGAVLPVDFAEQNGNLALLSAGNSHTPGLTNVLLTPLSQLTGPTSSLPPTAGGAGSAGPAEAPGGGGGVFDMASGDFDGGPFGGGGCVSVPGGFGATGEVTSADWDADGGLWVLSREPATLQRVAGNGSATTVVLSTDSRADTGWAVFHSNSGVGITCATCHADNGGDDGHVWIFDGIGPRRTQTLRGGISGTEPFHWGGDLPDFQSLVGEVYITRMGGPSLLNDQQAALQSWIDSIPPLPRAAPADPAAVARGQTLFNSPTLLCSSCHSGSYYTDNATVDVGTGGGFQVPRLVDVWTRPPYLHDGSAATLQDRFNPSIGGTNHGNTAGLTSDQINDLVAYLDTL